MTSKSLSQSRVDPAGDPKQALPSSVAARRAHWASVLEQSASEKDTSGDPEETAVFSDEDSDDGSDAEPEAADVAPILASASISTLPPIEEHREAPLVEGDRHAPFEGSEEKIPFWEDEAVRLSASSSKAKTKTIGKVQDVVPDMKFRSTLDSEDSVTRPTSPSESLKESNRGISRWRASSFVPSSSEHQGNSLLSYIRKASTISTSQHWRTHNSHELSGSGLPHGPVNVGARVKLTNQDEEMLSEFEADYDAFDNTSERVAKNLLSPNFRFFRWYAVFMMLALLIFIFFMPFRVGFMPDESGVWDAIDMVWNAIFFVDILIRLNTGFVHKETGTVVYDRRKIFWRYAKGWLIVDILAAFPSTFVPGLRQQDATGNHEIAYFLSLPKMFQLYGLMNMVQENQRLHQGAFLAISTLLSVIATAHLFGCGWYILATRLHLECESLYVKGVIEGGTEFTHSLYDDDVGVYISNECPWLYRNDYFYYPVARRYLGSVYWALTTLTTVGYGDLSARTVDEQVYSMCVQIVGVAWYGYTVGTWTAVLNSFDSDETMQRSKMREVVAFSKVAGLPLDLAKKVRQHFRFALYRRDNWITFNESEIVSDMPAPLRADVVTYIQRNTISKVPWFDGKGASFVADVVVNLKPRLFKLGDILFREGTQPEELYFITSGRIMLKHRETPVGYLKQGRIAGLIGLISCENHKLTAMVAHKDSMCFGLSRAHFLELTDKYPKEMKELVLAAKSLVRGISQSSPKARLDFMTNSVLAQLISKAYSSPRSSRAPFSDVPTSPREESANNPVKWTHLSIGHDSTQERSTLPLDWNTPSGNPHEVQRQQPLGEKFNPQATAEHLFEDSPKSNGNLSASARFSFGRLAAPGTSLSETRGSVATAAGTTPAGVAGGRRGDETAVVPSTALDGVPEAVRREASSTRMDDLEARLVAIVERLESAIPGNAGFLAEPVEERANRSSAS